MRRAAARPRPMETEAAAHGSYTAASSRPPPPDDPLPPPHTVPHSGHSARAAGEESFTAATFFDTSCVHRQNRARHAELQNIASWRARGGNNSPHPGQIRWRRLPAAGNLGVDRFITPPGRTRWPHTLSLRPTPGRSPAPNQDHPSETASNETRLDLSAELGRLSQ